MPSTDFLDDKERVLKSIRRLIEKVESGDLVIESCTQEAMIEEIEPRDGAKRFRSTGSGVMLISWRRNGAEKVNAKN